MPFRLLKAYTRWLEWRKPPTDLAQFSYQVTLRSIAKLYGREGKVVWASLFFPSEFIYAFRGLPFYPEIAAGLFAALGFAEIPLHRAEKAWFSQDLCSYHRLGLGASLWRFFPRPSFLLATTSICWGTVSFFQVLEEIFRVPCYILDVPEEYSSEAIRYLAAQLEDLAHTLKEKEGVTFQWEEVFHHAQKALSMVQEIESLRKRKDLLLLPPTKNLDYLPYYYQFMGDEVAVTFFEQLRAFLLSSTQTLPHRLLWLHLKPFYPSPLPSLLEEYGLGVVCEEFTSLFPHELNPLEPFLSLGEKIASLSFHFTHPKARTKRILQWFKEYQAEGAIQFNQWGCRQSQGMNALLRQSLRREGFPILFLDGDHLDRRHNTQEQWRTRLEAFAEILRG